MSVSDEETTPVIGSDLQRTPEPRKRTTSENGPFVDARSALEPESPTREMVGEVQHDHEREGETPGRREVTTGRNGAAGNRDGTKVKYMMEVVVRDTECVIL